jgi:Uma2 family endonuclease
VYEINEKVEDWLAAGVLLVWVVMPPARTVTIYRPDAPERILHENDELTADGLIPGLRCRVGDLFPRVAATE